MAEPTPEDRATAFARRWLSHESDALREIGRKELARLIHEAIEAEKTPEKAQEHASAQRPH